MSDATNREIASPPPVRKTGGAASLIRENRPATALDKAATSRTISGPPPALRPSTQPQTITSAPETGEERADTALVELVAPAEAPALPAALQQATAETGWATSTANADEPSTPYTRRLGAAPAGESPDDIIKVTFEIRRADRDAFNAAFPMVKLREGYETPKELLQTIYNAETRRIEETYNNGQPFPLRKRQLPRGRPIKADR